MATEEKVFKPTEITDSPLPGQSIEVGSTSQTGAGTYTPSQIKDAPLPKKIIAHETLGAALNTKAKKILQEFQFTQSGAIQIGKQENEVSGDIRISPSGILARNTAGENTIAIDGETGNVTIKGELQSGSVITGNIVIEEGGFIAFANGENEQVIDAEGLVSTTQFICAELDSAVQQTTTSNSYADVANSGFFITTSRTVNVMFTIFAYMMNTEWQDYGYQGSLILYDSVLSGAAIGTLTTGGSAATDITMDGSGHILTLTNRVASDPVEMVAILSVTAGTHNYKLQFKRTGGNGTTVLDAFIINIVVLGK